MQAQKAALVTRIMELLTTEGREVGAWQPKFKCGHRYH